MAIGIHLISSSFVKVYPSSNVNSQTLSLQVMIQKHSLDLIFILYDDYLQNFVNLDLISFTDPLCLEPFCTSCSFLAKSNTFSLNDCIRNPEFGLMQSENRFRV